VKRTDDARLWLAGGVVAAVLAVAFGWLVLIGPQISQAAALRSQAADQQASNTLLQARVGALRTLSAQLPALVTALGSARAQVPITSALSTFTDQLGRQATQSKVTVTSVAVAPAVAAADPTPAAGAASATGAAGAASAGTASGTGAGAGANAGAGAGSSPGAAGGATAGGPAGKLFAIPVTVITTGSLAQQRAFLTAVRAGPRASVVTATRLGPGSTAAGAAGAAGASGAAAGASAGSAGSIERTSEMTTQLTVFVAPQTPAATAELTRQLTAKPIR
jgi:hypothetical protein